MGEEGSLDLPSEHEQRPRPVGPPLSKRVVFCFTPATQHSPSLGCCCRILNEKAQKIWQWLQALWDCSESGGYFLWTPAYSVQIIFVRRARIYPELEAGAAGSQT